MKILIKGITSFLKISILFVELIFSILFLFLIYLIWISQVKEPSFNEIKINARQINAEGHFQIGNSWLKKNPYGVWEMYLEGSPYQRGKIYGELSKELIQTQEKHFVNQIDRIVHGSVWQHFLRLLIGFFNRDLISYIPIEYQQEMLGISHSFDKKYNYISTPFSRILNYHAAHDIGHALADYRVVACSSFGLKKDKSSDGQLLIGRNFDFYVGDEFAEDKLMLFIKPTKGYAFASYSWAGFIGVASGINEKGLTITINAAKSDLPTKAKMPISLLAREILQYCSNVEEAIKIAKKREVFVSESLLIGSKNDNEIIIIEKTPNSTEVYRSNDNQTICTNHYQSKKLSKRKENKINYENNDTRYRYERLKQLLSEKEKFSVVDAIHVLRDQKDYKEDTLGMGNPRAINQMIAHHSIVFQPERKICWISTKPYQLGKFISYNLDSIFKNKKNDRYEELPADLFLQSDNYKKFVEFQEIKKEIQAYLILGKEFALSKEKEKRFIQSNSELYLTYQLLGDYYKKKGQKSKATFYYEKTLRKNIASKGEEKKIIEEIKLLKKEKN
ncbi:MAG: peptidase C45 [Flavobacteriia bacterium]|nr:peptidase C45 [Flavobacteriia bacterium]